MSAVKFRRRDTKEMVSDKAEEMAQQEYGWEFNDLPPHIQMSVWMAAEQEVNEQLVSQAEAAWDSIQGR